MKLGKKSVRKNTSGAFFIFGITMKLSRAHSVYVESGARSEVAMTAMSDEATP